MTTISELSGNVDRLISVATDIKNQQGVPPVVTPPADDPAVGELNDRIVKAIDVLTGATTAPVTQPIPDLSAAVNTSIDPNAPPA